MNENLHRTGLRTVSIFEAGKGLVVLLAGLGVLGLLHRDVPALAERLIRLSHLDPGGRYPRLLINAATDVTDRRLWFIAGAAVGYAIIRGFEAYGLWRERAWAEWFALLSTSLYLPLEVYEMYRRPTWLKEGLFLGNLAIAAYLAFTLLAVARRRRAAGG
jgi:uncharacterized membrane protein (DUF2068 family)